MNTAEARVPECLTLSLSIAGSVREPESQRRRGKRREERGLSMGQSRAESAGTVLGGYRCSRQA